MKTIDKAALVTVLAVSAGLASGCSRSYDSMRVCGDAYGYRQPDAYCTGRRSSGGYAGAGGHWVYFSRGSRAPAIGDSVGSGSLRPASGVRYGLAPAGGVSRGGFGGIGEGFGGHGGFGE